MTLNDKQFNLDLWDQELISYEGTQKLRNKARKLNKYYDKLPLIVRVEKINTTLAKKKPEVIYFRQING